MPLLLLPAAILLLQSVSQEAPAGLALEDVDLLGSDDIRIREAAQERLARLPVSAVPFLRRRLATASDCESRERLSELIRGSCGIEAERLLREGRLAEALEWLSDPVEGEGGPERVRRIKGEVVQGIRSRIPPSSCPDEVLPDFTSLASAIDLEFGAWGMAVLFDALERDDPGLPAVALLQEMQGAVVPCLARALREGNSVLRREACAVLYGMLTFHDRQIVDTFGISAALTRMIEDQVTDPGTRLRSRSILDALLPGSCDEDSAPEGR